MILLSSVSGVRIYVASIQLPARRKRQSAEDLQTVSESL